MGFGGQIYTDQVTMRVQTHREIAILFHLKELIVTGIMSESIIMCNIAHVCTVFNQFCAQFISVNQIQNIRCENRAFPVKTIMIKNIVVFCNIVKFHT